MDTAQKDSRKESKLPRIKPDGASELNTPVVIADATTCKHNLIMKGAREMYCTNCNIGWFISGIEEYEKISNYYKKERG